MQAHLLEETLGRPGISLHLFRRALDLGETVHAHLGVVHSLAQQARALARPAPDAVRESLQPVDDAGKESLVSRLRVRTMRVRMRARMPPGAAAAMMHDHRALSRDERAEHLGEELHALARSEPRLE